MKQNFRGVLQLSKLSLLSEDVFKNPSSEDDSLANSSRMWNLEKLSSRSSAYGVLNYSSMEGLKDLESLPKRRLGHNVINSMLKQ